MVATNFFTQNPGARKPAGDAATRAETELAGDQAKDTAQVAPTTDTVESPLDPVIPLAKWQPHL